MGSLTAGHFSDLNEETNRLIPVHGRQHWLRNFVTNDPWLRVAAQEYELSAKRSTHTLAEIQFAIDDQRHPYDETLNSEYIVNGNDPRLIKAAWARARNLAPTNYSEADEAEYYAESMAQAMTGILIPFSEAGVPFKSATTWVDSRQSDSQGEEYPSEAKPADGYHIDSSDLHTFAPRADSLQNHDNFAWSEEQWEHLNASWTTKSRSINELKRTFQLSELAKHTPYQEDKKRLRILADATE